MCVCGGGGGGGHWEHVLLSPIITCKQKRCLTKFWVHAPQKKKICSYIYIPIVIQIVLVTPGSSFTDITQTSYLRAERRRTPTLDHW